MTKRDKIKHILSCLLPRHVDFFKRLYANGNLDKDINEVVDEMPNNKLKRALEQCEDALKKSDKWLAEWREYQIDNILKDYGENI